MYRAYRWPCAQCIQESPVRDCLLLSLPFSVNYLRLEVIDVILFYIAALASLLEGFVETELVDGAESGSRNGEADPWVAFKSLTWLLMVYRSFLSFMRQVVAAVITFSYRHPAASFPDTF